MRITTLAVAGIIACSACAAPTAPVDGNEPLLASHGCGSVDAVPVARRNADGAAYWLGRALREFVATRKLKVEPEAIDPVVMVQRWEGLGTPDSWTVNVEFDVRGDSNRVSVGFDLESNTVTVGVACILGRQFPQPRASRAPC